MTAPAPAMSDDEFFAIERYYSEYPGWRELHPGETHLMMRRLVDELRRLRSAPAAGVPVHPDTARMDWLAQRHVEVYRLRPYGSALVLVAEPPDVDACDDGPSDLREKVDAALNKDPAP